MPNQLIQKFISLIKPGTTKSENTPADAPIPDNTLAQPTTTAHVPASSATRVIHEKEHQIPRKHLDDNAAKVVYRLTDADHEAYLVGGCIRDLLLKKRPKDFDVATSAHPEEAHTLFKRSRLIGRRFKLLHVRFGREIIEVATFRADHTPQTGSHQARQSEEGRLLRDNVYGTIEEDAVRRDFTVNALYYSLQDHNIYDFANGYEDIQARTIRMIGEPEARYREDPVRMLRAIRFAAKLDFTINPDTAAPITRLASLLQDIPAARMFDEVVKLLQSGDGMKVYLLLQEYQLFTQILPQTAQAIAQIPEAEKLVLTSLRNTDRRLAQGKSVTPAFLFAALLWHPLQSRCQILRRADKQLPPMAVLHEAANQTLAAQASNTVIPRRFSTSIREIWELQLKLPRRTGKRAFQTLEHPRFRAAYDLLLLREQSGEALDDLGDWWTRFQSANQDEQNQMVAELAPSGKSKRPPRKRRSRAANDPRNQQAD